MRPVCPILFSILCALTPSLFAASPPSKTFTFKKSGDLELKADVYLPADMSAAPFPVAVWCHGGALIMGNRTHLDARLRDGLTKRGIAFVSIDYRLAPETKIPDILTDLADACHWVRQRGPDLFNANPKRIAVLGMSAGGYLALASGHVVKPSPDAIVSLYGYGELTSEWYGRPSRYYLRQPLVSRETALAAVGNTPLADGAIKGGPNRGPFYLYCRQQGTWPLEIGGVDPNVNDSAFDPWCPLRNVSPSYPPTILIHGTHDDDVPYEQSVLMDKELALHKVEHQFFTIERGLHGLFGGDKQKIEDAYAAAIDFVEKKLRAE